MKNKIFKGLFILLMIFGIMGTTAFALNRGDSFVDNGIHYEVGDTDKLKVISIDNIENLESIEIPGSLEHEGVTYTIAKMESDIFDTAINLKNVSIPDTLDFDPDWFLETLKLENINVVATGISDPKLYSRDGVLFGKIAPGSSEPEVNILWQFPASRSGVYNVPDDTVFIYRTAFADASLIEVINLPDSCSSTGRYETVFWDSGDRAHPAFARYNVDTDETMTSLREINVSEGNQLFKSENGIFYLNMNNVSKRLYFPGSWQGEVYTLPENLDPDDEIFCERLQLSPYLKEIVCPENLHLNNGYVYGGCFYSKYYHEIIIPQKIEILSIPNGEKFERGISDYLLDFQKEHNVIFNFKEIKVSSDNPDYSSEDGILYDKTGEELLFYPNANPIQDYTIKDGVTTIGEGAFLNSSHLKSVVIPESVEKIMSGAFGLSGCQYVFIKGNNLTYFFDDAFAHISDWNDPSSIKLEGNLKAVYCEDADVKALIEENIGVSDLLFDATFEPATMNDDVEATQNEDGTVSLKWSGDSDGYEIRRYDSNKRSTYTVVGKVDGETSYTDMKVDQGVQYQYSVVPYNYYKSRSNHEDDPFKDTIQYGDEKFTKQEVYIEKTYTVKFLDKDGNLLKEETVKENESATAPEIPVIEGYTFKKWDKEFTNVQSDLEVKAIYTENKEPEIVPPNNEVVEPDHNETLPPDHTDNNDKLIFDSIVTDNGIHYDTDGNKVKVDEKGNKVETSDTAMISCLTLLMLISGGYIVLKKYNS